MEITNQALSALRSLLGRNSKVEEVRFRHTAAIEAFLAKVVAPGKRAMGLLSKISRLGERVVCRVTSARRLC